MFDNPHFYDTPTPFQHRRTTYHGDNTNTTLYCRRMAGCCRVGGGVSGVVNWTGAVGNIYGGSGSRLVSFDNPVMARSTPILDPHIHQVEQSLGRFVQSIRWREGSESIKHTNPLVSISTWPSSMTKFVRWLCLLPRLFFDYLDLFD